MSRWDFIPIQMERCRKELITKDNLLIFLFGVGLVALMVAAWWTEVR